MTYDEAVDFLKNPIYNLTRPGLDAVTELMTLLGNPQNKLKYVHIAGTNGKGSVSAMTESVLRHAGYKTGLYTSPFIERFTERIRIGDEEISRSDLARLTERVKLAVEGMLSSGHTAPTIFEMVTAVAFMYFFEKGCDIVILEVGMGGRLDATNIIKRSEVSVITRIGTDHTDFLGHTIEEIAGEKAGIIKEGCPVVAAGQRQEVNEIIKFYCDEREAPLIEVSAKNVDIIASDIKGQSFRLPNGSEYRISLLGKHQIMNALTAISAVSVLRTGGMMISEDALKLGLKAARWNGRLEVVYKSPIVIIDGAHNVDGAEALAASLSDLFPQQRITFIIGVLADKDIDAMLKPIIPSASRFLTVTPPNPRALSAEELANKIRRKGCESEACESISSAIDYCIKNYSDEVICAFGSLYYIGEIRAYCLNHR